MKPKLIRPVDYKWPIKSPFGMRVHPKTGKWKMHNGFDFSCPEGTEIRAVSDGHVIWEGWEDDKDHGKGYGLRLYQEIHYKGIRLLAIYAHLLSINAHNGQMIPAGGLIAMSGNTGSSTGPHLHFGVREKDTAHFMDVEFEEDGK